MVNLTATLRYTLVMQDSRVNTNDRIAFHDSKLGTLGVEMEWMTVDRDSGQQVPAAPLVFSSLAETPRIKPELFTSIVEINTDIHHSTPTAMQELRALYLQVDAILQQNHAALLSSSSHPLSHWRDQTISDDPRYHALLRRLRWVVRRFNICGIHTHVGMPDGDSCIHAMNQLLPIMPMFLAISANSPFWHGEATGLAASRIKIFEGLSQGGMPFYFKDWADFEHCASRLKATGSIDSVRDIWWEMRPHPTFGTLEIRIGDMPGNYADSAAYIAYVRAEAIAAAMSINAPTARVHPSLIRENRWRACRYGMSAIIIDPHSEELIPLLDWLQQRLDHLAKHGADSTELAIINTRIPHWRKYGGGAEMQRKLYNDHTTNTDNNIHDTKTDFAAMIQAMRQQDGWHA